MRFDIKKINQVSNFPQMGMAFVGWTKLLTLIRITQSNVNGFIQETEELIKFNGVIQPLNPEEIELKPEGQRAFEWLQIHAKSSELNLVTNDRIKFNDRQYKVMGVRDYSLNNYIEYHLIEDFV